MPAVPGGARFVHRRATQSETCQARATKILMTCKTRTHHVARMRATSSVVMPRASSTPQPLGSSTSVSGILGHPPSRVTTPRCLTDESEASRRHCERSEAIRPAASEAMDCFVAELVIGRVRATRWLLAMTALRHRARPIPSVVSAQAGTHYPECQLSQDAGAAIPFIGNGVVIGPGLRQDDDREPVEAQQHPIFSEAAVKDHSVPDPVYAQV